MKGNSYVWAALLGSLAFSLKNIGYVLQKRAVNRIIDKQGDHSRKLKYYLSSLWWLLGVFFPLLGGCLLILAYLFAPVSFIMPFMGIGLVVLVLFCRFYLKEKITGLNRAAMGVILIGTLLITITSGGQDLSSADFVLNRILSLKSFLFIIVPNTALFIIVGVIKNSPLRGLFMGLFAGILGGSALLIQKPMALLFASYVPGETFLISPLLSLFLVILLSLGAVLLLNFGYNFGSGIYITPIYSTMQMIFPILGGIIVYDEWHSMGRFSRGSQGVGFLCILIAISILSSSTQSRDQKDKKIRV